VSTVLILIASTAVLVVLWAWTIYHLIVLAMGWPHANRALASPFRPESLRNPVDLPIVTIIVAARDEENVIRATLESIDVLRYPKELLQVLVAEDGSSDRTEEICQAFAQNRPHISILHKDVSSGKASALNRAFPEARGNILLFLDADTKFEDDLLLKAAKFFHDNPEVDVAQTVIETYADGPNLIAKLDRYEAAAWYRGIVAGKDRLGLFVPLCGTGMFIRRRALEKAGPWDEQSLAEDLEMAVRLAGQGSKASMLPAQVWRQPPYSARDFVSQRRRWWGGAMQTLPEAIRLWRNRDLSLKQKLDMAMQLLSPFFMVGGTIYLLLATLTMSSDTSQPILLLATTWGVISSQLILVGFIVVHSISRRSWSDLALVPGIYLYWILQLYASFSILIALVFRRLPRWTVTHKRPSTNGDSSSAYSSSAMRPLEGVRGEYGGPGLAYDPPAPHNPRTGR
jgi:cellulose synthase/poly-beta-1,6-N-acetylglucosamine synthase-like glycosyltransferase